MSDSAQAFVCEAELDLSEGMDPAAVGAAVTTELCGHWQHDGPCRWPHNNEIHATPDGFRFRTLFSAGSAEEPEVRERIEGALRGGSGWVVVRFATRAVTSAERPLASKLVALPRQSN